MLANPDGTSGYAQAGYFRYNAGAITTYAEYNPDGGTNNYIRTFHAVTNPGTTHRYEVDYEPGCGCIRMWVDGSDILNTNFNPLTRWGNTNWAVETFGETKDFYSDMPGLYGTSGFFSALGTDTSTQGFVGWIGWNQAANDYATRWFLGRINEFPISQYGYNFQIYTK